LSGFAAVQDTETVELPAGEETPTPVGAAIAPTPPLALPLPEAAQ
jgi:hypothetical protein